MTALRYALDSSALVRDGGRLLVGGSPPRLLRLSKAGADGLDAILNGRDADPATAALARRLERHGLIHPLPGDDDGAAVTTVLPVRDGGERLGDLVAGLAAEGPVIVIDDGSRDNSADRAESAGARVIRHQTSRGPAAARNAGLTAAATGLVAFLDADCMVAPGWRRGLAGLLAADPDLAIVGPRVRSAPGDSALARYEQVGSPLDLGPHASLVGPERRVAYLPSAAMLVRRDALLDLGGFDESLRFGEDIDLVWRLLSAGHRIRYAPSREVFHLPRPTIAGFARQRADYGGSAPELLRRHAGAAAPLRPGRHTAAIWGASLLLGPKAILPALGGSAALVARRGTDRPARRALAELAISGQAGATAHLARVLTREWLPATIVAAALSRRARRLALAALVVDTLPIASRTTDRADLARNLGLHAVDRTAYAAGLWREMAKRRDLRAILPRLA